MANELQYKGFDMQNTNKIVNLLPSTANGEPVIHEQLLAAVEGIAWKDSVRVSTQGNISLAAPGATIDGITMVANDRILVRAQTTQSENGIYIWNGAAVAATRSLDASTSDELEQAVVTIEEGTNAGNTYRQTQVNFTLGSGNVVFTTFGSSAGAATEASAGIAEIATQAETDTGTDDARIVTPLKLSTSPFAAKKFSQTFGDGTATSFAITHNLGTEDVIVSVKEVGGLKRRVQVYWVATNTNTINITATPAPVASSLRVTVSRG
jgi:hypothetical protein